MVALNIDLDVERLLLRRAANGRKGDSLAASGCEVGGTVVETILDVSRWERRRWEGHRRTAMLGRGGVAILEGVFPEVGLAVSKIRVEMVEVLHGGRFRDATQVSLDTVKALRSIDR